MKRSFLVAALAGTALVSLPFGARAQVSTVVKPVQFGIAAGVAFPTSDLSEGTNTGFNVTGTLALNPAMIPLGIRIDAAYNRFEFNDDAGVDGNFHFTSVTGNVVYKIPSTAVAPYLIGGAGLYNVGVTFTDVGSDSENHFGWNIGGGISMPLSGFDAFIEARYNQVQGDGGSVKFIPVTFGIMF
ncbi:MAG: outer membrane beta-barrel protein [Gemmatimonadaceae bacterium]